MGERGGNLENEYVPSWLRYRVQLVVTIDIVKNTLSMHKGEKEKKLGALLHELERKDKDVGLLDDERKVVLEKMCKIVNEETKKIKQGASPAGARSPRRRLTEIPACIHGLRRWARQH